MKALCVGANQTLVLCEIPTPEEPAADHVIIRMDACAINPGDKFFLGRTPPPDLALSLYNVWGVSGAGTVMAAGEGVPPGYVGKKTAVYRSLQKSENLIGTWSEYSQLHRLDCVLLPNELDTQDYSGSLVNARPPGRPARRTCGGSKASDDRQQGSGCKKAIGKRDAATRGGKQLGRVGPYAVSLGACLFTYVRGLR